MAEPIPREALARAVRNAFGAAARVTAAEPLAGDASSRRYVRLRLADAPTPTAVAMLLAADVAPAASEELGTSAGDSHELAFVNVGRYLTAHGLPVPALYHDAAAGDRLLLLEDIGDQTLWTAAAAAPEESVPLFEQAVDLLVAIQRAGARDMDRGCVAFRRRFDEGPALAELEHFVDHGIETRHGRALPAPDRRAVLGALAPLLEPFAAPERMLAHRDFMAWNLHVQGGRLRIIDFQDALLAPDAFDLAQLLTDRTTGTIITPEREAHLIACFRRGRAAAGLPVPGAPEAFLSRYRACALQHALKVIGRFYFLERVRGKPGYLAYLPAVYAVGRRMFAALPALEPAWARIVPLVPELAPESA